MCVFVFVKQHCFCMTVCVLLYYNRLYHFYNNNFFKWHFRNTYDYAHLFMLISGNHPYAWVTCVLQPCFSVFVNVNDEGVALGCVHSRRLAVQPKLSQFLSCSIRPSATFKIALFMRISMQSTVKRKWQFGTNCFLLSLESMVLKLHEMLLRGQEWCS